MSSPRRAFRTAPAIGGTLPRTRKVCQTKPRHPLQDRPPDVRARAAQGGRHERLARGPLHGPVPRLLRITEIYYDGQTRRTEGDEFIEIQNQAGEVAYLARVLIRTQSATARSPVTYGFPVGTKLDPGETLVVAKNARQFTAHFGSQPDFEARYSGSGFRNTPDVPDLVHDRRISRRTWALANSGATVALLSDQGAVLDVIAYGYDPGGYMDLRGHYPSAAGGQSLRRIILKGTSPSAPSTLREGAPSPGTVPPPPTPVPTPSPTSMPSPTAAPSPSPTPLPPAPTPTPSATPSPPPTPTPVPTSVPSTPTPRPTPTPTPPQAPTATPTPPPTPTPTRLQCLTAIDRPRPVQRVDVDGVVTEVRSLPKETLVFIADRCGGAVLHLGIGVRPPPTGSHIRFTAFASREGTQIDLNPLPDTHIRYLPGKAPPEAIPFTRAILQQATTGTRVWAEGRIAIGRDFDGSRVYASNPGYLRLDPNARAVPTGAVDLYGIIEWQESVPRFRVHFVAPRAPARPSLKEAILKSTISQQTMRFVRSVYQHLVYRSLARGPWVNLP